MYHRTQPDRIRGRWPRVGEREREARCSRTLVINRSSVTLVCAVSGPDPSIAYGCPRCRADRRCACSHMIRSDSKGRCRSSPGAPGWQVDLRSTGSKVTGSNPVWRITTRGWDQPQNPVTNGNLASRRLRPATPRSDPLYQGPCRVRRVPAESGIVLVVGQPGPAGHVVREECPCKVVRRQPARWRMFGMTLAQRGGCTAAWRGQRQAAPPRAAPADAL